MGGLPGYLILLHQRKNQPASKRGSPNRFLTGLADRLHPDTKWCNINNVSARHPQIVWMVAILARDEELRALSNARQQDIARLE